MGGNAHSEPTEVVTPVTVDGAVARKVLACQCDGDCTHWEVSETVAPKDGFIKCKTCGTTLRGTIVITDEAKDLHTIEVDEK